MVAKDIIANKSKRIRELEEELEDVRVSAD